MDALSGRGAVLRYHDPYVASLPELGVASVGLEMATADADAVVLVTAHPGINYAALADDAPLFVDLREITRGSQARNLARL